MQRPIVICCSQRFKAELQSFVGFLEKKGVTVLYPDFKFHRKKIIRKPERLRPQGSDREQAGLVFKHLQKIRRVGNWGGICLIYNPLPGEGQKKEYGYVGDNTLGEIFYCEGKDIGVVMLKPTDKRCAMAIVSRNEPQRTLMEVFTSKYPKGDPLDNDFVWDNWLKHWLNGGPRG